MKKRWLCLLLAASMSLSLVFASADNSEKNKTKEKPLNNSPWEFSDVNTGHWAYKSVKYMVNKGIFKGYSDNKFKPQNIITREEFATIMVKALGMNLIKPDYSTFKDVPMKSWSYKFVETAKPYLTGYKIGSDLYYKPQDSAVREDMAVALVLALEFNNGESDMTIIEEYGDKDSISENLQKYVALAIKHDIMKGYPADESGVKYFKPFGKLTRAEASVLLFNALKIKGLLDEEYLDSEKIVFGESKKVVVNTENDVNKYENQENVKEFNIQPEYVNPESSDLKLEAKVHDGEIKLYWREPTSFEGFKYYKVVASKYKEAPKYPEDGYLSCLTDKHNTIYYFNTHHKYNGGDIGTYFEAGVPYYFSITYVYNEYNLHSETVKLSMPY